MTNAIGWVVTITIILIISFGMVVEFKDLSDNSYQRGYWYGWKQRDRELKR